MPNIRYKESRTYIGQGRVLGVIVFEEIDGSRYCVIPANAGHSRFIEGLPKEANLTSYTMLDNSLNAWLKTTQIFLEQGFLTLGALWVNALPTLDGEVTFPVAMYQIRHSRGGYEFHITLIEIMCLSAMTGKEIMVPDCLINMDSLEAIPSGHRITAEQIRKLTELFRPFSAWASWD